MTLILAVGNDRGVYLSSDYRLTDAKTGATVSTRAGAKQLQATFSSFAVGLAFTGIAGVGGRRTIDLLAAELKALDKDSRIEDLCASLATRCEKITKPHGKFAVLTLVLVFSVAGKPLRVAVISNADWKQKPPQADAVFTVQNRVVNGPFSLIHGDRDSVPLGERLRLRALSRATDKTPTEILNTLAEINTTAATNSHYVGNECWLMQYTADGTARHWGGHSTGSPDGSVPQLHNGTDSLEHMMQMFRAAPGKQLRLVQTAGVMGGGKPLPPPVGTPRSFALSTGSADFALRSPDGSQCASLRVEGIPCELSVRLNDSAVMPLIKLTVTDGPNACAPFPKPRPLWPTIKLPFTVNAVPAPNGLELSICHWVEGTTHHLVIPVTSRGIRNLSFLGKDEELVIVIPNRTVELTVNYSGSGPPVTLDLSFWWRTRPDGSSG